MKNCDICIIGAGPAGLSAAIYGARAGLDVVVLEKFAVGGQMNVTPHIQNYAGVGSVSGVELSSTMGQQALDCGAQILYEQAVEISVTNTRQTMQLLSGEVINSRALILAMGAQSKTLGLEGEAELVGSGVSYCATCDGAFFRGKDVVVVGGSRAATLDVEYLSPIVKTVTWVHSGKITESVAQNVNKIEDSIIVELSGNPLSSVTIKNFGGLRVLPAQGLFVAVGYSPSSALVKNLVALDAKGYIITNENMETSLPNVYAIGDLRAKEFRQIVTATSDGAIATFNISKSLKKVKKD